MAKKTDAVEDFKKQLAKEIEKGVGVRGLELQLDELQRDSKYKHETLKKDQVIKVYKDVLSEYTPKEKGKNVIK